TFPFTDVYKYIDWITISSALINFALFYFVGSWIEKLIKKYKASREQTEVNQLKKIRTLHLDTLHFYLSHIVFLLFVVVVLVGLSVASNHILSYKSYGGLVAHIAIAIKFLLYFARLFIAFVLLEYVSNPLAREAFRSAGRYYASYLWLSFFLYVLGLGGLLFFIIPGLLILGWASVAVYAFVFEQKRGIQAFYRSKELVSGRWWAVVWRWVCLFAPVVLITFGVSILLDKGFIPKNLLGEVISNVFLVLFTPYIFIYWRLLYESLVSTYNEPATPRREKKIPYIIFAVLGLLITIPILLISVLNITAIDEQPPYDQDLIPQKMAEVPKEQNLFEDSEFPLPHKPGNIPKIIGENATTTDMAMGKIWNDEVAQKFIDDNKELFAWIDNEFLKKLYYQDPAFLDPATVSPELILPSLNSLRIVARAESIRAEYLFRQGKEKEAIDESIKILRMGDMIIHSQGSLIEYLVAIAVKDLGYRRFRLLIDRSLLSQEALNDYLSRLERFRDNRDGLRTVWKYDYLSLKWTMQYLKDHPELVNEYSSNIGINTFLEEGSFYNKPNKTLHLFADTARRNIANVDRPCNDRIPVPEGVREVIVTPNSLPTVIKYIFTENLVGKTLDNIISASFGSGLIKKCSIDFSAQSSEILLAMKIYELENKTLPVTLNDLIYIIPESILKDPFDGNQIRYSKDKKIIYSIGSDGVDSGGSDEVDWSKSPDPTLKFSF
ncbi:MAG: hypothetical protein AAB482_01115, partial [Patescibacteria group bacterium]